MFPDISDIKQVQGHVVAARYQFVREIKMNIIANYKHIDIGQHQLP